MKKTNKRIKNRIKILFIGVLMLAAAVIISAGDIIFKAGNLDVSNNLAVNTDALYVDSANKKVGIGTTSPSTLLTVKQSAADTLFTGTSDTGIRIRLSSDANGLAVLGFARTDTEDMARIAAERTSNGAYLRFGTSNSYASGVTNNAMTIDYNGNVGIGTVGPAGILHTKTATGVNSAVVLDTTDALGSRANFISFRFGGTEKGFVGYGSSSKSLFYVNNDNGNLGLQTTSGNVGIGTTSPSQKLDVAGYVKGTGLCIGSDCKTAWPSSSSSQWTTSGTNIYYNTGNVGIGTESPAAKLHVAGVVKATAFKTGDIFFNKGDKPVWRMFEDEDGLYVESLTTGKVYGVMLKEISAK